MFIINYKDINKNINITNMIIEITNADTGQHLRTMTEEELFNECGKDKKIFEDYIRHIKSHTYIKPLNEYWKIVE